MSNYWATPQEHNENVRRQRAFEQGITTEQPKQETKEETLKVEVPTVVLPDGTSVPVDEYDPYAQRRKELETQELANNVLKSISTSLTPPATPPTKTTEEEKPIIPAFNPLEFTEEDIVDETTEKVAGHFNQFVQQTQQVQETQAQNLNKLITSVDELVNSINTKNLEDNIETVSKRTGFSREELFDANAETNIDNPEHVATYLIGRKAMEEEAKKKAEEADEERKRQAAGVKGTSNNGSEGEGQVVTIAGQGQYVVQDKPKDIDYNSVDEIVKHFDFRPVQ